MDQVRRTFSRAAGPIATIGAAGGFIGDVLQPLGDIAPWVMAISFMIALLSGVGWLVLRLQSGRQAWESVLPVIFALAAPTCLIFALWTMIFAAGPERGYLADNVEPIAQLQARLLGIEEDVAEIRETTTQTQRDVEAIATAQVQGFEALQASFAQLQSGNAIIESPTTPQEWYSNARLYELKGNTAKAIEAYEGYMPFGLEFVDPFMNYADLLKASEGIDRTQQRFDDLLAEQPENPALALVAASLTDSNEQQLARAQALADREPHFGPVFNLLGQLYDRLLRQGSTRDLLEKQAAAYGQLFELEASQGFSRYFIDKGQAAALLDSARIALESQQVMRDVTEQPTVITNRGPEGIMFIVAPSEANIKELRFGIDEPTPTHKTGTTVLGSANATIGPLDIPVGEHVLTFQYLDQNDVESPIWEEPFTIDPIMIEFSQSPTDFSTGVTSATFVLFPVDLPEGSIVTFAYSVDDQSLGGSVVGAPFTSFVMEGLSAGDHILYIQIVEGASSDIVAFPFTIE